MLNKFGSGKMTASASTICEKKSQLNLSQPAVMNQLLAAQFSLIWI
jgi:hypothetical protein